MRIFANVFMVAALAALISLPLSAEEQFGGARRQERGQGGFRGPSFERVAERFDANRDGKITREEFGGQEQMFDRLDRNGDGVITKEDFEGRMGRGGRPSRGGMPRFQEFPTAKPAPGHKAPDFQLHDLDGNKVSLSKLLETRPVVLEFGSFT
ncbi:MAG: EF-hand domain-containing protein [Blastocatellia bacterium]|nr:EF-hand domain-containing protein [Blastocatellia bacterium]